jgi:hypothetical protein
MWYHVAYVKEFRNFIVLDQAWQIRNLRHTSNLWYWWLFYSIVLDWYSKQPRRTDSRTFQLISVSGPGKAQPPPGLSLTCNPVPAESQHCAICGRCIWRPLKQYAHHHNLPFSFWHLTFKNWHHSKQDTTQPLLNSQLINSGVALVSLCRLFSKFSMHF